MLYFRDGTEFSGTDHTDCATRVYPCGRCGGAGRLDCFRHVEGGICFECNGTRTRTKEERLYSAEKLAKLNATATKRAATKAAKHAAARAAIDAEAATKRDAFEAKHADVLRWLEARALDDNGDIKTGFAGDMLLRARHFAEWTEAQEAAIYASRAKHLAEKAAAANSRHVGQIGERLELTVTVTRETEYWRNNRFSYHRDGVELVYITSMRDAAGNTFVVKSPSFREAVGSTITIRGTVKEHSEFRGEAQTVLARVTSKTTEAAA
jgi:hypothetical protein